MNVRCDAAPFFVVVVVEMDDVLRGHRVHFLLKQFVLLF